MAMPIEIQPGQVVRPPRVEFETRAEEDRDATIKAGRVMFKDVDYVKVTPPGAYSVWEGYAEDWLKSQEREPYHHLLLKAYEAFKQGKEPPLNGTAVENCTMFTPAEVKQIKLVCRTVEELAEWPDGSLGMFGMGGTRLKQKAQSWMASANSTGTLAARLDALEAEKASEKATSAQLREQLAELQKKLEAQEGPRPTLKLKETA